MNNLTEKHRAGPSACKAMAALLLATTALGVSTLFAAPAHAQAGRSYDIPAGELADVLNQYARESGVALAYRAELAAGIASSGLKGRHSPASALSRILSGTGITFRQTGPRAFTLEPAPQADSGTIQLGSVRVEGASGSGGRPGLSGEGVPPTHLPYQTAQSSVHISQERIEQNRGTSPGDFLAGTPGVLNGDNRNSGALDVNIRGMQGMGRVPVVIDGSLQQTTVYRGYSGVAGRTYIDPDLIGSVTIEKGPSAAADGVGSTGGVVRVSTIGINDLVAPDGTFGIRVRAGLTGNNVDIPPEETQGTGTGSAERWNRPGLLDFNNGSLSVAAAGRLGIVDLVGAYARRKLGNYFGGENGAMPSSADGLNWYTHGEEVLNSSQDNTSYLARAIIRPEDDLALDLSYVRYESDFGEAMPSSILRFGGALQGPPSRIWVDTFTGRARWNPYDNDLIDLKLNAWATNNFSHIIVLNHFNFGGIIIPDSTAYMFQSKRWGINLSNNSLLHIGSGTLEIAYGASYNHEKLAPPKEWEAYKAKGEHTRYGNEAIGERDEYSAFLSAEWKPQNWLTLNAALRYTRANAIDKGERPYWSTRQNEERSSGFAPILSALIEPLPGLQFYARYAEAIRAPSLFESAGNSSMWNDPDVRLKPEHARNTEVGINFQRNALLMSDDLIQTKLAWFANHVDDYISRGPGQGNFPTDARNYDRVEFQGIEFSAHYDAGPAYAELGVTHYTHQTICMDDWCETGGLGGLGSSSFIAAHMPPKTSVSGTLGARFFDERLSLGARVTHNSKRFSSYSGGISVIAWPSYTLFDLFGSFRLNDTFDLSIAVDNVTDRYYMDPLTTALMPSPGRTARIGLTSRFGGPENSRAPSRAAESALGDSNFLGDFDGSWTGFYIGGHVGFGWLNSKGTTTDGAGTSGGVPATESADFKSSGGQPGLHLGYNHQLGNVIVGVEADWSMARVKASQYALGTGFQPSSSTTDQNRRQASYDYGFDNLVTLRARLGYSLGRVLVYATGGLALLREEQERTQYRSGVGTQLYPNGSASGSWFSETDRKTRTGYTVGGGAELAVTNSWSIRADYGYTRFGKTDFAFPDARLGIDRTFTYRDYTQPFPWPILTHEGTSNIVNGRIARNNVELHSLRLGVSYRF